MFLDSFLKKPEVYCDPREQIIMHYIGRHYSELILLVVSEKLQEEVSCHFLASKWNG
jgi:hypothetical protein